jgi:hypothetical protein
MSHHVQLLYIFIYFSGYTVIVEYSVTFIDLKSGKIFDDDTKS